MARASSSLTEATDIVAEAQPGVVRRDLEAESSVWMSPAFGVPNGTFGRPTLDTDGSVVAFATPTSPTSTAPTPTACANIYRFTTGDTLATR